jgi:iodotyrosine deiodinase
MIAGSTPPVRAGAELFHPGIEMTSEPRMKPLEFARYAEDEQRRRAREFLLELRRRRTVRQFSDRPVPQAILDDCIAAAATAPSGANKQPWTFVLVTDPALKLRIREGAENEERAFYGGRAPERWLRDLEPFGTDAHKPFLEIAPALIVVFAQKHGPPATDERHYYVQESVGIAVGFLLAALHHAGLATLTHTPSPMGFLGELLGRPANERAFVLIPVGYPADDAQVPDITKKPLSEVLVIKGPDSP